MENVTQSVSDADTSVSESTENASQDMSGGVNEQSPIFYYIRINPSDNMIIETRALGIAWDHPDFIRVNVSPSYAAGWKLLTLTELEDQPGIFEFTAEPFVYGPPGPGI